MGDEKNKTLGVKDGIVAGFPIVIGYFPIAMTFGILSKTMGISFLESFLFSAMVYAGTAQFMALNLLSVGVGIAQIVLTIFLVNFRHFLMSASVAAKMEKNSKWTPFIAFGITDESFSVASFKGGDFNDEFMVALQFISYISWIAGTVSGYLIGEVLPITMRNSMEIGIYAMFTALLVPKAKQSSKVLIIA
ncbi:MAG: AzlC family ABC transporter permease, partial [Tissierellia bacterium]|nr:AzlC family ABC transporter permease [Tissierellia bacterium]